MGEDTCELRDKRVIITGASKGLGQVCAEFFAKEGSKLLLTARSQDSLEKIKESLENPGEHKIYAGDLTRPEKIEKLIETAEKFGDIDVILHVMGGGLGMRAPLLTWEEFDILFKTNLASAAEINRLIIPRMIQRKTGNVVHVGSTAGTEATVSVGYNSVKAALAAYVRSLGRELADTGVIVTGILPGGFWAPNNSWVRFERRDPELLQKIISERQPKEKLGDAKDIIPMMLFLASRRATMMTGCCVPIDGGEGLTYIV